VSSAGPSNALHSANNVSERLTEGADLTTAHHHFCRGCGLPLITGSRSLFHPECLKEDKRRRVRQQRQQQHELFERWLRQETCPKCGARYGELRPDSVTGTACEASQPP
jgi:hypothetical protein